jgi:hypothetical protein
MGRKEQGRRQGAICWMCEVELRIDSEKWQELVELLALAGHRLILEDGSDILNDEADEDDQGEKNG